MKAIFACDCGHFDHTAFVVVHRAWPNEIGYAVHDDPWVREQDEEWRSWWPPIAALYRINVYPKHMKWVGEEWIVRRGILGKI